MPKQSSNTRSGTNRDARKKQDMNKPVPPLPTVGHPLDGSQFQNIVEEQKYSEQRPSREEQQPRHANLNKTR